MVLIVERFDFQTIRLHSVWFPIVLNTTSIMRLRYKWGHLSMTTFSEYYQVHQVTRVTRLIFFFPEILFKNTI